MEFGNILCLTENQLFCIAVGANGHFGHILDVVAQWKTEFLQIHTYDHSLYLDERSDKF